MPKRTDINKIMVIGSGPIVIGQAAEFDYAGTQACLALKEEGYEVVLVNSNPATIMTDTQMADKVYMEPLDLEYVALEEAGIPDGSEVLVCVGTNFADSLSASSSGRPIFLVDKSKLSAAQEKYLEALKEKGCRFTIIGSPAAVSEAVEAELSNYSGSPIERVAGKTRYETSIEVAEHVFEDPDSVVLTVGNNFPDGLSAGPLAYELGAPVVLTLAGQTAAAEAYAAGLTIRNGIAVGGSNVLSNDAVVSIFSLESADEIVEYTR